MIYVNSDESIEQYVGRQLDVAEKLAQNMNTVLRSSQPTNYQAVTASAILVAACVAQATHSDPAKQRALLNNITEYITMLTERMSHCARDVDYPQKV